MQRKRFEYWQLVQGILTKDLIFIDEAGVNLAMTQLFARAPKGQRARGKRPNKRGQNVSMIGAISLTGVVTQLPILRAVDGITFEAFIAQQLVQKLWKGACVILDNCSATARENRHCPGLYANWGKHPEALSRHHDGHVPQNCLCPPKLQPLLAMILPLG